MCGRYATSRSAADLSAFFEAYDDTAPDLAPSWNVAPTDPVPVVRLSRRLDGRVLSTARWGLVPTWAKNPRSGARMINARSETVATSSAYAGSFARRRCLVPADGWFEWVRADGGKQAYYLTPSDGAPLAFAGLWSPWGAGDETILTCTVLTAPARGPLTAVHERMPVLVPVRRWSEWLNGPLESDVFAGLTPDEMISRIDLRPVGPAVGNVRNNGPELVAPIGTESRRGREPSTLF